VKKCSSLKQQSELQLFGWKLPVNLFFMCKNWWPAHKRYQLFGTVKSCESKTTKLKWGDTCKGERLPDSTGLERQASVHLLTNMHRPPTKGRFRDDHGKAQKPVIVDYSQHMGYRDKGDRMANSCSVSHRTWKWTKYIYIYIYPPPPHEPNHTE